jgi:hypothetical protein
MMDGGKRGRDSDEHPEEPPLKRTRLDTDADAGEQQDPPPPPPAAPPPPPPPPASCSICLTDLNAVTFAQDQVNGTISLVCQQGLPPHEFHASCLEGWVYSSSFNPNQDGQIFEGVNFWKVLPPRCPLCRVRFLAGDYWAAYAAADGYPDDGIDYQTLVAVDGPEADIDVDSNDEYDVDDGDGGGGSVEEYSDSDDGVPYVASFTCTQCNFDGPHDEMTADDLINTYGPGPFACVICNTPVAQGDDQAVLRCQNCGAVSHYHD